MRLLSHLIAPPFCTYCRNPLAEQRALCVECMAMIQPVVTTLVPLTKTGKRAIRVHAVGRYHGPLQQLILAKKYSDALACFYMAQLICERTNIAHISLDYIVPIPLHWRRYAKRGYNQSQEIAKAISKQIGVPVLHALKRIKHTPFQSQCSKDERAQNVADAFTLLTQQELKGKRIALIDDVMTTGATLRAAASTLAKGAPEEIQAVVLART